MLALDRIGSGFDRGGPQALAFGRWATAGQGVLRSDRVPKHLAANHHGEGGGEYPAVNHDVDVVPVYRMWNLAGRQREGEFAG